jgi:prolyl-tRNA editing enzyme YbaK/EbsC (Cys-tRNA(Pro) deacylase)
MDQQRLSSQEDVISSIETVNGDSKIQENAIHQTIQEFQDQYGPNCIRLVSKTDHDTTVGMDARPINSLIFSISILGTQGNHSKLSYLLAILDADDIASRSALQEAAARILDADVTIRLAPSNKVLSLCGFAPGSIPPVGLNPPPTIVLVEESLLQSPETMLLGVGGAEDVACLISASVLMQQQPKVHSLAFRRMPWSSPQTSPMPSTSEQLALQSKPFFAMEPPCRNTVRSMLLETQTTDDETSFQPEPISVVGRIRIIRRMARQLAFCDLGPPKECSSKNATEHLLPWRSPMSNQSLAVQLILGKTLCQKLGPENGVSKIKSLRVGDLVLVEGMTNVGNRDSLQNWVDKSCFDLVVWSIQCLDEIATIKPMSTTKVTHNKAKARHIPRPPVRLSPGMSYLCINDLYGESDEDAELPIVMVDTPKSIERIAADVSTLLASTVTSSSIGLIGIDTEWRPSFLFNNPNEPQVVLLLQICLHPHKQVYLLDLQALLRPLRPHNELMNSLETQVSQVVGQLFLATNLFKVGFQVTNDLGRLAASYPHIPAFQEIQAVLETSTLAKTVMRVKKLGNMREVTSSLSRLTEKFIGKTINKDDQCSDWSIRPLTATQIEYAALDAMVTPCLVEKLLGIADVSMNFADKPSIGRWKDDSSFTGCISSMRFLFLDQNSAPSAIRKLSAKRVIGSPYIVSQFWSTGSEPPQLPTVPSEANNGQYTGTDGIIRVPSLIISLEESIINNLVGEHVGKSKERCLSMLLTGQAALPAGAKLEFPQRSGYVEFMNAVALFVNMPASPGRGNPRSYPNEWLDDGRTLTWFLRESDWKQGTSPLAKKLGYDTVSGPQPSFVVLFVRSKEVHFICCGRCRVESDKSFVTDTFGETDEETSSTQDWDLVQLNLKLLDYDVLTTKEEFAEMALG